MNTTTQMIVTIITAVGGLEFIKYILNLRSNKTKARAEAEQLKTNVLNDYVQSWKLLCDKQGEELDKKQITIDKQNNIIDKYRDKEHKMQKQITTLSIDLKEAEFDKCIVHNCIDREPPRRVTKPNNQSQ